MKRISFLVTMIWLISIIGICVTLLPFYRMVLSELRLKLLRIFNWIVKYREQLGYILTLWLFLQALVLQDAGVGTYLSISGIVALLFMIAYSIYLREPEGRMDSDMEWVIKLCSTLLLLEACPLAIYHQSQLIGFLTVICFFCRLGFFIYNSRYITVMGFDKESLLDNCLLTSLSVLMIYTSLIYSTVQQALGKGNLLNPFSYGVYVFGVIVFYLALLIKAFGDEKYARNQILMFGALFFGWITSHLISQNAWFKVTTVLAVFYVTKKVTKLDFIRKNFIIALFLGFFPLNIASPYLYSYLSFVLSIFQGK